jgi:hypothetical protein
VCAAPHDRLPSNPTTSEGERWSKLSHDVTSFLHAQALGMQLSTPVIMKASVLADPKLVSFIRNILLRAIQDMPLSVSTPLQCVLIAFETEVACAAAAAKVTRLPLGSNDNNNPRKGTATTAGSGLHQDIDDDTYMGHVTYVRSLSKALLAVSDILKPREATLGTDIVQLWVSHAAMEMRFANDQGASRALDHTILMAKQCCMGDSDTAVAGDGSGGGGGGGPGHLVPLLVLTHVRMIMWPQSSFENAAVLGRAMQDEGGRCTEKSWRSQPVVVRRLLSLHALCGYVESHHLSSGKETPTVRQFHKELLKGFKALQKRRRKQEKKTNPCKDEVSGTPAP